MSSYSSDITGVILAGGRSSRFGSNKAFATFGKIPFIQTILRAMGMVFSDLLIVTNTPEAYLHLPVKIVVDHRPYEGPLGGIATALATVVHPSIFVVGCDMPLIGPARIREVVEAGVGAPAALALHGGQPEYLFGLYSKELLPRMREFLSEGQRSLYKFFADLPGVRWIPIEGEETTNINTPEDLETTRRRHAL